MSIVRTHTGRNVSLAAPDPATIEIRDIACSLARINRFSGATRLPVNVACHSLNVTRALGVAGADAGVQLLGLLHDAHEAYIGDITTPMKREIAEWAGSDLVSRIAERLDAAIHQAFGLVRLVTPAAMARVRWADAAVRAAEWRDLMEGPMVSDVDPVSFPIKPRNADKAEDEFLKAFARLRLESGSFNLNPAASDLIK